MGRPVLVFVVVAYALSIALSLVIGLTGGYQSRLIGLAYLSMLIPSLSVLVAAAATREPIASWSADTFPPRYLPVALFLIPIVMHAVMLPTAAVVTGLPFQPWLTPQADGLYHAPPSRGWGVLTTGGLAARVAINAIVGLIIVSILAFFEEVGWRGWLLSRLADDVGARRGVVVCSVIWAFWHTPYALSGIHHLDGVPTALAVAIMPIGIAGAGLVIGWLWLRTDSIWLVSIAHGSLNSWGQYAFKFVDGPGRLEDAWILVAGGLALLIVGSLLLACGLPGSSPRAAVARSGRSVSEPA